MKTRIFSIIVLAACTVGCQSRSRQAAEYNDQIIDQQYQIMQAFEGLDTIMRTRDAQRMDDALVIARGEIIKGLRLLDTIGTFHKDEILLKGAQDLFATYEALSKSEYPEMIGLLKVDEPQDTAAHVEHIYRVESEIHSIRTESYDAFLKVQEEFGKQYNLDFQEHEPES